MSKKNPQKQPYALQADEGWIYHYGIDMTVKAGEVRQDSGATFMEFKTVRGEEPEPHTHDNEDEMFYVLKGKITFHCGGQSFELKRGGFIFLPHGLKHSYTIKGKDPVGLIVVTNPVRKGSGGWGGFIGEMESGEGELVSMPSLDSQAES